MIEGRWADADREGGCQGCGARGRVLVFRLDPGGNGSTQWRLCGACWEEMKKAALSARTW